MKSNKRVRLTRLAAVLGVALGVAACDGQREQAVPQPVVEVLPVSTSDIMESLINHSADPLFAVSWGSPNSEAEWLEIEQMARQLELGGSLLPFPGTGSMDGEWTADAAFTDYAGQLTAAAARALDAAQSRREEDLRQVGNELSAVCNACHREFASGLPEVSLVN